MAYEKLEGLYTETTIKLGGVNKKTGKPNPKEIEGFYKGSKDIQTDLGPTKVHVFKTSNGLVGVWGAANLNYQLATATIGLCTKIVFTGTRPSKKGSAMQVFDVFQDKDSADSSIAGDSSDQSDESYLAEEADDVSLDSDDSAIDEVKYSAPVAPKSAPQTATASQKATVEALLNKHRQKVTA